MENCQPFKRLRNNKKKIQIIKLSTNTEIFVVLCEGSREFAPCRDFQLTGYEVKLCQCNVQKTGSKAVEKARQSSYFYVTVKADRCSGKAMSTTYSECVSVALVMQHSMHMRHIDICGLNGCADFSTLSHKRAGFFGKKKKSY